LRANKETVYAPNSHQRQGRRRQDDFGWLLAHIYAGQGQKVLAIDADPASNLASALSFPEDLAAQVTPIAEMEDLIAERTKSQPGTFGGFFKMNPKVEDIPDRFAVTHRGIKLLIMGTIDRGGSGCVCPESVLLKNLVTHLLLSRDEVLIMDMEAGIEHLGRATAQAVDAFIIVVEPGKRSLQTAKAIKKLAGDIGIKQIYVVGNKVRDQADRDFVLENLSDFQVIGCISNSPQAIEADRQGISVFDLDAAMVEEAKAIASELLCSSPRLGGDSNAPRTGLGASFKTESLIKLPTLSFSEGWGFVSPAERKPTNNNGSR
jgi:CO dehydrogenase maturation factor